MVGVAIGGIIAGVGAYAGGQQARRGAENAARSAQQSAAMQAANEQNIANQQRGQAETLQREQHNFEQQRQQAQAEQQRQLQEQATATMREQEALARQGAAETALSEQNQRVSDLTPTVSLAAEAGGDASANAAKKRRAQFRPEYTSGVTI